MADPVCVIFVTMRDDIGQRTCLAHRPTPGARFGLTWHVVGPAARSGTFTTGHRPAAARSGRLDRPEPYTAVAVIPRAWAGVESVLSIQAQSTGRSTAQAATRAPARGIVASFATLVLACVIAVVVLLPYAFYDTAKGLQNCTVGSNTAVAAADCNSHFNSSLNSVFSGLLSAGRHAGG